MVYLGNPGLMIVSRKGISHVFLNGALVLEVSGAGLLGTEVTRWDRGVSRCV